MNRFLDSEDHVPEEPQFAALGHAGSTHYAGLETFENPGCHSVSYISDEVMSKCPITGQPDFYTVEIQTLQCDRCLESKSLKLFFQGIIEDAFGKDIGIFCEGLAVHIRDCVVNALETEEDHVQVTLIQKSRGGISIKAVA